MKSLVFVVIGSLVSLHSTLALDYTVTVKGGWGEVRVDKNLAESNHTFSDEGNSFAGGAAVVFDSNITTGLELSSFNGANFLGADDRASLSERKLYLGYRFDLSDHFRLVPVLGVSNWKLRLKEGALSYFSEIESDTLKDTEVYGQLNVEFPINDFIAIVSSIQYTQFDFGVLRNAQAGVMFQF